MVRGSREVYHNVNVVLKNGPTKNVITTIMKILSRDL
jgi:hypothetical protein